MKSAAIQALPRTWLASLAVLLTLWLSGCAAPQATSASREMPFEQAVAAATDGLVSQTQMLPAFLAKVESKIAKRGVVVDPFLDSSTGQQTNATKLFEKRVTDRLGNNFENFDLLPFQSANLGKAQYLLTGTMTRAQADHAKNTFKLNLALTELRTGKVVAQASAQAQGAGLDNNPLPYYRDSPVLVKDQVLEGYIRTTATAPGQKADAFYTDRIAAATLINEATNLYNSERYQEALGQYRSALATPAGEQLRVLNGIYLANVKLGRSAEAETAFGKVVAMGIAYNELGVKFLFNPGSTEFWSDQRISGAYGMWLRQIAKESVAAKVCMDIIGHTSRTGSEQSNDSLSLQRAAYVKQRLTGEASSLGPRTKATGMGFRQNIVGSGSDNAVDALDRRVEFKIVACG
jgi:tetratricopeptide (TPR) repeat protein